MSLAAWMTNYKAKRREGQIAKNKKRIKNRYGQGEDRQAAIAFFSALGGTEGAAGLLERYMVNVEPTIRDEEEKEDVYRALVAVGRDAAGPIEDYINRRDAAVVPVGWPLKVLAAVCSTEEAVGVMLRALERLGTAYTREPERKVLLVAQLAEYKDPRVVPALLPFLRDHRDEVQLEALAALTKLSDDAAREPMLELLIAEDTPVRIRAATAEALQKLGWQVTGHRKQVEEILPEGLAVDRSGKIKGRWKLSPQESDHEEG